MSIINDALKKAQTGLEQKESKESSNPKAPLPDRGLQSSPGSLETTRPLKRSSPQISPEGPSSTPQPSRKTLATIEKEALEKRGNESPQKFQTQQRSQSYASSRLLKSVLLLLLLCLLSLGLYIALSQDQFRSLLNKIRKSPDNRQSIPQETITVFSPSNPTIDSSDSSSNSSPTPAVTTSESLPSPAQQKETPVTSLNLKGIVTMNNKQFALINDGIYEEGSIVQGKRVVKIALDQVELKDDTQGGILTLTIQSEQADSPANP